MINEGTRHYLLQGLAASPVVLERLLKDAPKETWDRRPDPARFTLREVVAHLADWEPIWLERISRIRTEERPTLPGYDPDQFAQDNHYQHLDIHDSLKRFQEGRSKLLKLLESLQSSEWERRGLHAERGLMTALDLAVMTYGHDGYHLRQVVEWLQIKL